MKTKKMLALAGVLALAAGIAYDVWHSQERGLPDGLIQANGRIEGDRVLVASKYPGRLAMLAVREGDTLKAGALVARLDSTEARSRLDAARAQGAQAEAMRVRAAAASAQAERDARRFEALLARGSVDRMRTEQMRLAATSAAALHAQAHAQWQQAQAAMHEAGAVVGELTLTAPSSGVVLSRLREPGEVLGAGSALIELVNLDTLYLKVYVPEKQIGQIRLGLPARIYSDAFPQQPFDAVVSNIAARAEFTPKEVQTQDERVKLVYAVKLALQNNPQHRLTPGLPADAVIRTRSEVPWQAPRW